MHKRPPLMAAFCNLASDAGDGYWPDGPPVPWPAPCEDFR